MNIYVGNLPKPISEDKVRTLFEQYGQVAEIKLIKDQYSGEMRGFGFVEMPNRAEALTAIEKLNGALMEDNRLVVNQARPREARSGGRQQGGFRGSRFGSW
ncbi:MAG: RNA recognition motif [bacterium ADurb.Bin478]|nr:MAG: RNA recognition motif [bacterium ADurb.Bin478]